MGYHTEFFGHINVEPPLSPEEIEFLNKFNQTRRMLRKNGPYYVDNKGYAGQDPEPDIVDYNQPPTGQPGLWCGWRPTPDGTKIEWDGGEKFYYSLEWMEYLINHFIGPHPVAAKQLPFLKPHTLNGKINCKGEEHGDVWCIKVTNNAVTRG